MYRMALYQNHCDISSKAINCVKQTKPKQIVLNKINIFWCSNKLNATPHVLKVKLTTLRRNWANIKGYNVNGFCGHIVFKFLKYIFFALLLL